MGLISFPAHKDHVGWPGFGSVPSNLLVNGIDAIPAGSPSVGVKGWIYNGQDAKQTAYWIRETDGISAEHRHEFGTAGARTFHCFGGKRV